MTIIDHPPQAGAGPFLVFRPDSSQKSGKDTASMNELLVMECLTCVIVRDLIREKQEPCQRCQPDAAARKCPESRCSAPSENHVARLNERFRVHAAIADGSVRFISENIDPAIFEALSTIAGGEPIPQ